MNIEAAANLTIRGSPGVITPTDPTPAVARDAESPREKLKVVDPTVQREEPRDIGQREAEQVVEGINAFLRSGDSHIEFALHEKAKRLMVEVINNQTQEVVRTFPPKELLDLAVKIGEMVGTLIDRKT